MNGQSSSPMSSRCSRRVFLARSVSTLASTSLCYSHSAWGQSPKNERPAVALVGAGFQPETKRSGRGIEIGRQASHFGDIAVICEVDSVAAQHARRVVSNDAAEIVTDYRRVLDREDIDAVLIATPDHWHAKIAIEAMYAGKDVYCEKPATTTIGESQKLRGAVHATGQLLQIGTQQRSEYDDRFLTAIALVRHGRIGKLQRIRVGLNPGWEGGPFDTKSPPPHLDWDAWLGPAPMTDYIRERTHRTFRWWFEYGGGNLTDWGAHHVDIAQWAIEQDDRGPIWVDGTGKLNQPLELGLPTRGDTYNTPIDFSVRCQFANDVEMVVDSGRNGITFEGTEGRFFVNRGTLEGTPVTQLRDQPLPDHAIRDLYGDRPTGSHMRHFFDCLRTREKPISDIDSHHHILTTCHLANLSIRLGRKLLWDPEKEEVIGDDIANGLLSRAYRSGYEINV